MSDTPRTDALCRAQKSGWDDLVDASQDYVRLLDFARQLERELETMRLVAQQNGEDLDECREQKAALSATATQFEATGYWNGKVACWEPGQTPPDGALLFRPTEKRNA